MIQEEQNSTSRNTFPGGTPQVRQGRLQRGTPSCTRLVLLIVLDATGSMTPYVTAVGAALRHMLDILVSGSLSPEVGMIVFRDELEGEMPEVYAAGTPPEQLRKFLARVEAVGGGTLPESSLPALMKAAAMLEATEQGVPRVVLHVTDAPPHDPEAGHTARSVLEAFKQERVLYFGCTPDIEPYRTFANVTGGTLFPIEPDMRSKTFEAVLQDFARTTVKTVRAAEASISEDVRALLRAAREED